MMAEKLVFGIYHDVENDIYKAFADIDPKENAMLYILLAQTQNDIINRMKPMYGIHKKWKGETITEEIIYTLDVEPDGRLKCGAMFPIGPDGDLSFVMSEHIRHMLHLNLDEQPIFESSEDGKIIMKKKKVK